jgi:hypothetical protein
MLRKTLLIALLFAAGLGSVIYMADDLWARYRGKPTVEVRAYRGYMPQNSWRRSEYAIASPEDQTSQTCVQAMLPHFGYSPCWYLLRKSMSRPEQP